MRLFAKVPLLALFVTVTAVAAPDGNPPATTANEPPAANPPPAHVLTPAEMNVTVAATQTRLDADLQSIGHLQEVAKKQKDVIKLNCVNDRLVQVKAQMNIVDELHVQLSASLAKGSDDRQQLFDQYSSGAESVRTVVEQAKGCVGGAELYKQESGVTVDAPFVPDDPTVMSPPIVEVEPPASASPYD